MISKSQLYLLEAIKSSLFEMKPQVFSDINWNEVIEEAQAQTVLGLISPVIPNKDLSIEQSKSMYMRIMYEQDRLLKCFNVSEIPCVILKGCAAAIYYPRPYLRTMGDIDILVPRRRFIESIDVLESNGYIYVHGEGHDDRFFDETRELAYIKNGIIIELHKIFSSPGVEVDEILEIGIEKREFCELNGYAFPMLPCLENGLVLLGHINQHLNKNGLGLRQIIDWEMYIHSVSDNETWKKHFISLVNKIGLQNLAAYITKLCNRYLGLPEDVSFGIETDDSIVDELLEVVLTDGNFGSKAYYNKNIDEVKLMSASYGIRKFGFFGYFTRVGMETSSFCKKHDSVKIVSFFYGFFKQVIRGIVIIFRNKGVGNNLVEGKQMQELHSKRRDLFKKLGVKNGEE